MQDYGHHFVAVIGGSVAGSEAADQLARRGFRVVVFDQNTLPYGKIEDGLPKWHAKLRDKEEAIIAEKLHQPNIRFVPGVRLGRDVEFQQLVQEWGFSAVLLATGAWKDRPLPVPGADQYEHRGLAYQNSFVYWYNHHHEPTYSGATYTIPDNALIVGGGLASLDVVKIVMITTTAQALAARGISTDMFELERGIGRVLEKHQLTLPDLGLRGCTLVYRRSASDMPLSPLPKHTPEQRARVAQINEKILENFQRKYLFQFLPYHTAEEVLEQGGALKGLLLQQTEVHDGVVMKTGKMTPFHTDLVISSIGSIPEPLAGTPFSGGLLPLADQKSCRVQGYDHVFAVGNAVTGRGNIKESQEHGKETVRSIMDEQLHFGENDYQQWLRGTENTVARQVGSIAEHIQRQKFMPDDVIQSIINKTTALQQRAGYNGDLPSWLHAHTPVRYEQLLHK
jgi:NADPH-dependent glutamate synthase beta subunit-like oxidoreductase